MIQELLELRNRNAKAGKNTAPWGVSNDSDWRLVCTLLVGHKIVAVKRGADSKESFPQDENPIVITLENGLELHFSGWGYDACGLSLGLSWPELETIPNGQR